MILVFTEVNLDAQDGKRGALDAISLALSFSSDVIDRTHYLIQASDALSGDLSSSLSVLRRVLQEKYAVRPEDITVIDASGATREKILSEAGKLVAELMSGHIC